MVTGGTGEETVAGLCIGKRDSLAGSGVLIAFEIPGGGREGAQLAAMGFC